VLLRPHDAMNLSIWHLATASLWNRRATALLTIAAVGLSVALLLSVEKLRRDAKDAFANTISGTDLIVGARSGALQLMLYSVFRIGNATNNVSWESYQDLAKHKRVRWTVPMSLGDSHHGFRVLGTTAAYFKHYRYARKFPLKLAAGRPFEATKEVVLGAAVARELGYKLGQSVVIAHGAGEINIVEHDEYPMSVVGILARTGTPVDRTIHVSLESITLIHDDPATPLSSRDRFLSLIRPPDKDRDLTPKSITAFLVGTRTKIDIFRLQRDVNRYSAEPLAAVIPGVALQELWDLMSVAETLLRIVSVLVVVTGLIGMMTVIMTTLEARRREIAVLRAIGARPAHVFALFVTESAVLVVAGIGVGLVLLYTAMVLGQTRVAEEFGLHIPIAAPALTDWVILAAIVICACFAGCVPAWLAYRRALVDGLSVRI
jgi:putative ABC transport system permease protein